VVDARDGGEATDVSVAFIGVGELACEGVGAHHVLDRLAADAFVEDENQIMVCCGEVGEGIGEEGCFVLVPKRLL
jgi:hypothetical protein